jgi:hypothetical protein
MNYRSAVAVGLLAFAMGVAADVAGATVLNFDDQPSAGGPNDVDVYGDFQIFPSGGTADTKCYPENSGCLKEVNQGEITRLSRVDGGTFDLTSFYFVLVGNGNFLDATFSVLGSNGTLFELMLGDALSSFAPTVVTFVNGTPDTFVDTGKIENNQGYIVDFSATNLFKGITYVDFLTDVTPSTSGGQPASSQGRLDCVTVNEAAASTTCVPTTPSVVPLPAAGWLLLAGVGGLLAMRRKKAA